MITGITRGTLRPNLESRVFDILRVAAQAAPKVPGMVSMSISRKVGPEGVELIAVTAWSDVDAMASVLGPNWVEPSWLPGLGDWFVETSVEMLETVVSSVEDLIDLQPTG